MLCRITHLQNPQRKVLRSALVAILSVIMTTTITYAAGPTLSIQADYPGGNVIVESIDGMTAHVAPDLRTTKNSEWFYWDFTAKASQPGRAKFIFNAVNGARIAMRGPAYSLDDGKTWQWLGTEHVVFMEPEGNKEESFEFDFTKAGQEVRFAVGFPYVQSNLVEFLKAHAENPNLTQSTLTKSQKGRPVELLQIGKPGPGIIPVLVAARSHSCEALGSYVLEGFLSEALSDSPTGVAFRKKYVLYAVPFLDKDGVEDGDQGKGREPHDHNRDYGSSPIYPEIKALQELAAAKGVKIAIDFHCPYIKGDVHEAYHWLGLKMPHIANNTKELNNWLDQERPQFANTAINFLKQPTDGMDTENIPFSWYFARQPGNIFAITLESPYAQAKSIEEARAYGQGLLRAFVRTDMEEIGKTVDRTVGNDKSFVHFGTFAQRLQSLAGNPEEASTFADSILSDPTAPSVYKAQAYLGMAVVQQRQGQFDEAVASARATLKEPEATAKQKITALILIATVLSQDPASSDDAREEAIAELDAFSFAAPAQRAEAYKEVAQRYEADGKLAKALEYFRKRTDSCLNWQKSGSMLQEAAVLDAMNKAKEAVARRQDVVNLLKTKILNMPETTRGIQGGIMAGDYFDALNAIPTATKEEKIQAAKVILNYSTPPVGLKERIEEWMSTNGG